MPIRAPPPLFNWGQRPLASAAASMLSSPNLQHTARLGGFPPQGKDEPHIFLMPHHSSSDQPAARIEDMMGENENDIKWPNGLSFFTALTGQTDDATKLLFNPESLENNKPDDASNPNEFLSLDSHHHQTDSGRKMDKFKRSMTVPARVASSSSSTSMDHHHQQQQAPPVEYRNSEGGGMYPDVMETFLE